MKKVDEWISTNFYRIICFESGNGFFLENSSFWKSHADIPTSPFSFSNWANYLIIRKFLRVLIYLICRRVKPVWQASSTTCPPCRTTVLRWMHSRKPPLSQSNRHSNYALLSPRPAQTAMTAKGQNRSSRMGRMGRPRRSEIESALLLLLNR